MDRARPSDPAIPSGQVDAAAGTLWDSGFWLGGQYSVVEVGGSCSLGSPDGLVVFQNSHGYDDVLHNRH